MMRKLKEYNIIGLFLILSVSFFSCSNDDDEVPPDEKVENVSPETLEVIPADVAITQKAIKIEQLVGQTDRERDEPTRNRTYSRYGLQATDLGVPFQKGDTTFVLFGDTWGDRGGLPNTVAYTLDKNPENGLELDFVVDESGSYYPLTVSQISQNEFEVPTEGIMIGDQMYIYHTTDHSAQVTMGRSILAKSNNDGARTFEYLYDFSTTKFINVSVVQAASSSWEGLPSEENEESLITFGSGAYRQSEVFLGYQPALEIENPQARSYFAGVNENEEPVWEDSEIDALPIFDMDVDCVGEFSVSYNEFIKKWILLYNCENPRGINLRTADNPWGPWTEPQVVFEPWEDEGYCNFIHVNWLDQNCDELHDPGRENEWGGEYGPYQFEHFATGDEQSTTIYFTMSTWNPYTVVLMKTEISL
ncbi:DUF4185 domain-containing protein [Salegentibacter sp. T436]|uniref:DUF4185 domain-containing protein n=1 Tax=Salegentibacter sp. T436 TaxID=1729720 RepID=UPI0009F9CA07|nr:DUF4185 domain-containing protein [Salegentibacter sp. T436]